MANFGSILKNLRLSRNITQGELAAKALSECTKLGAVNLILK